MVAAADRYHYDDPLITGTTFSEHNGVAELEITGSAPLMANFADGGKTIIVTAAPGPPPTQAVQQLPLNVPQSAPLPCLSRLRRLLPGRASW